MRLVSIENVKPPVYLAKPIYGANGIILLPKGTRLTDHYLERIKQLDIRSVYVDDGDNTLVQVDEVVSEEMRAQVVQTTKETLLNVKAGNSLGHKRIEQAVEEITHEILRNKELMIHLTDIRSVRDHTFTHSTNVCILSLMTGLKMGYDDQKLKDLGTGALLHDVGKALFPEQMINSSKIYTPEERQLMQAHCEYGFEILKSTENISPDVAQVALQHHERYNGKGYPRGLAGEEIHEYARIVAVADVYDAFSSDRPYRKRLKSYEVVELIRDSKGIHFDPDIAEVVVSNIAVFPVGSLVLLNSGYKGMVVSVSKEFPTRPRVRLLYNKKGERVEGLQFVDLMKELTLLVTDVLE